MLQLPRRVCSVPYSCSGHEGIIVSLRRRRRKISQPEGSVPVHCAPTPKADASYHHAPQAPATTAGALLRSRAPCVGRLGEPPRSTAARRQSRDPSGRRPNAAPSLPGPPPPPPPAAVAVAAGEEEKEARVREDVERKRLGLASCGRGVQERPSGEGCARLKSDKALPCRRLVLAKRHLQFVEPPKGPSGRDALPAKNPLICCGGGAKRAP